MQSHSEGNGHPPQPEQPPSQHAEGHSESGASHRHNASQGNAAAFAAPLPPPHLYLCSPCSSSHLVSAKADPTWKEKLSQAKKQSSQ